MDLSHQCLKPCFAMGSENACECAQLLVFLSISHNRKNCNRDMGVSFFASTIHQVFSLFPSALDDQRGLEVTLKG